VRPADDPASLDVDTEDGSALDRDELEPTGNEGTSGALAYLGTIAQFSHGSRTGVVRTASGRDVPFDLEHVVVAESMIPAPGRIALEVGQPVGYDVGWTSRGLRVTRLFPPQ
jgi:hypothetical protein